MKRTTKTNHEHKESILMTMVSILIGGTVLVMAFLSIAHIAAELLQ